MRIRTALHKRLLVGAAVLGVSAAGAAVLGLQTANAATTSSRTPALVEVAADTTATATALTPEAKRACLVRHGVTITPVKPGGALVLLKPGPSTPSTQQALKECGYRIITR